MGFLTRNGGRDLQDITILIRTGLVIISGLKISCCRHDLFVRGLLHVERELFFLQSKILSVDLFMKWIS